MNAAVALWMVIVGSIGSAACMVGIAAYFVQCSISEKWSSRGAWMHVSVALGLFLLSFMLVYMAGVGDAWYYQHTRGWGLD